MHFNMALVQLPLVRETPMQRITTPADAHRVCQDIADLAQECFQVLCLNAKNCLINRHLISHCNCIYPLNFYRRDLAEYAACRGFPIIPCNLCGSQENLQRQAVKEMLRDWERTYPGRIESIFASIANVAPSQLADTTLFDFASLRARPRVDDALIRAVNVG